MRPSGVPRRRCRPRASTPSPIACIGDRTIRKATSLARFSRTGVGARGEDTKLFVLDLVGEKLKDVDPKNIRGAASALTKAKIQQHRHPAEPATGGWRLSFELPVKDDGPVEMRALPDAGQRRDLRSLGLSMDTLTSPQLRSCRQPAADRIPAAGIAPLAMPTQALRHYRRQSSARPISDRGRITLRRAYVFIGTAALTLGGCYEMYQVLQVGGITMLEALVLVLFVLLFAWIAFSFMSSLAGFFVLLLSRCGTRWESTRNAPLPALTSRNAMLLPTYNEEPYRVMARLQAICESVGETGQRDAVRLVSC